MKVKGPAYLYYYPAIMLDTRLKGKGEGQWFIPSALKPTYLSLNLVYGY